MSPNIDVIRALTDPDSPIIDKRQHAESFSRLFGWRPNDLFDVPSALPTVNLIVEQGLENAAMLSFMPVDLTLHDVRPDERKSILGLSYNSLIDWHVWVDRERVECFYNRVSDPAPAYAKSFDQYDYSALTKQVFDEAIGNAPKPDFMTLDGALFDTITTWREILRREIEMGTDTLSSLFNAIILARAVEDFQLRIGTAPNGGTLLERVTTGGASVRQAIEELMLDLTGKPVSDALFNRSALENFDDLPPESRIHLVEDFYRHKAVPYDYDFSVMSKYALSKIYERYVAIMREESAFQIALLPSPRDERWNRELGGIYTPQYIAAFFAKYLRGSVPPNRFLKLSVADPACGSGIFLRAIMEEKLLYSRMPVNSATGPALDSLFGVDIDQNAAAAARLSLSLLHLAATGELPDSVPIVDGDSMEIFANPSDSYDQYDAVIVNPPFVRTELQSSAVREAIRKHADVGVRGKLDTYLAFLTFSIRALKPGGFGCFVVPQSLLTSDKLKPVRDWVLEQAWVHVVADLSAIRIFKADVYVALLIVEKKINADHTPPSVSVIRCQRDVGLALADLLDGTYDRKPSYVIYRSGQESLTRPTWAIPLPEETALLGKLEAMSRLNEVAVLRQGVITGADDIFILDANEIPDGEERIYARYMPDTAIGRYALPSETGKRILYPFIDGVPIESAQMERDFPKTWERLNTSRDKLSNRRSAPSNPMDWWRPSRPRVPGEMLAPKVMVPKLFLLPRFGVDVSGGWIASHSPIIRPRFGERDIAQLYMFAAILNSSIAAWYLDLNGRKFAHGYNEIGISLLRRFPIPNLSQVPVSVVQKVVETAGRLTNIAPVFDHASASELDDIVLRDMYRLDEEEIGLLKPSP